MTLRQEYQKLVTLSECNGSELNPMDLTAASSRVLFLLQKNSKLSKNVLSAKFGNTQQPKVPATKTVAATLAQAIGSRYQGRGNKESCFDGNEGVSKLKEQGFESDVPSFLPILARMMINCANQKKFKRNVAEIALLHFFDPILFPILCDEFKQNSQSVESPFRSTDFYQEPEWWKSVCEDFNLQQIQCRCPLEYLFALQEDSLDQLRTLSEATVKTLNATATIHWKLNSAVSSSISSLLELLLDDSPTKDSSFMIICHQKDLVERIYSLSILGTDAVKKQSGTIIELLVNRRTAITVYGLLHSFFGAQQLLNLYSQKQKSVYEFVVNNPFVFILDFLDQKNSSTDQGKPIQASYIGIASQKVAALSGDEENRILLYECFNRASKVRSMFAVFNSFIIETVKFNFQLRRDHQSLKVVNLVLEEFENLLPPLAKPNYFFVDRKPPKMSNDVIAFELSYDIADLNISVHLILYSLRKIVKMEIDEVLAASADKGLIKKLSSRTLRLTFCCFFAVLFIHNEYTEHEASRTGCVEEIARIFKILAECFETHGSLFYMTLFNFANDVCHANAAALPSIFEMIRIVIESCDSKDQIDFVESAVESLQVTFGRSINGNVHSDIHEVKVPQNEYCSLYGKKKADKSGYSN